MKEDKPTFHRQGKPAPIFFQHIQKLVFPQKFQAKCWNRKFSLAASAYKSWVIFQSTNRVFISDDFPCRIPHYNAIILSKYDRSLFKLKLLTKSPSVIRWRIHNLHLMKLLATIKVPGHLSLSASYWPITLWL